MFQSHMSTGFPQPTYIFSSGFNVQQLITYLACWHLGSNVTLVYYLLLQSVTSKVGPLGLTVETKAKFYPFPSLFGSASSIKFELLPPRN